MTGSCMKCGGSTTRGFLLDHTEYGSRSVAKWQEGEPKKSFWTGIRKGDLQIDVRTMRCNRCGFLESYAK